MLERWAVPLAGSSLDSPVRRRRRLSPAWPPANSLGACSFLSSCRQRTPPRAGHADTSPARPAARGASSLAAFALGLLRVPASLTALARRLLGTRPRATPRPRAPCGTTVRARAPAWCLSANSDERGQSRRLRRELAGDFAWARRCVLDPHVDQRTRSRFLIRRRHRRTRACATATPHAHPSANSCVRDASLPSSSANSCVGDASLPFSSANSEAHRTTSHFRRIVNSEARDRGASCPGFSRTRK